MTNPIPEDIAEILEWLEDSGLPEFELTVEYDTPAPNVEVYYLVAHNVAVDMPAAYPGFVEERQSDARLATFYVNPAIPGYSAEALASLVGDIAYLVDYLIDANPEVVQQIEAQTEDSDEVATLKRRLAQEQMRVRYYKNLAQQPTVPALSEHASKRLARIDNVAMVTELLQSANSKPDDIMDDLIYWGDTPVAVTTEATPETSNDMTVADEEVDE